LIDVFLPESSVVTVDLISWLVISGLVVVSEFIASVELSVAGNNVLTTKFEGEMHN